MQIHPGELSDVSRYLDGKRNLTLDDMRIEYEGYLRLIRRFVGLTPETRILEVGTGTGWFPLLCARDGWRCKGLEISPQLIDFAREFGARNGLVPDIELANIEEYDIGENLYDAIFANSVFEHIENWQLALDRVFRALRPGGMFFFASTNKFSPASDEYPMPFYGWLPDSLRYRFRVSRQGADIMKLGIDFNQFTYPGLRRAFRRIGFHRIYDRIELVEAGRHSSWKRLALLLARRFAPLKAAILTFCDATTFVCIK
jgi:SAM-dependent methyltransferase